MTTESDVRKLKKAVEELSKAVEDIGDELEKQINGQSASASTVSYASHQARRTRFNI